MDALPKSVDLVVAVARMPPRVGYTLNTALGDFSGLQLQIVPAEDAHSIASARNAGVPVFGYAPRPIPEAICLPCNGLLYEEAIRPANEEIDWLGSLPSQLRAPDYLAQIFYHLTQYALLRPAARREMDGHGRHLDGSGELVVHRLLDGLRGQVFPHLPRRPLPPRFEYEITIDVDHPWKYKYKPILVQLGGMLKALLRGGDFRERWDTLLGAPDPFDVLPVVRSMCPADKTRVFFLVGGSHANDSRFDLGMKPYRQLVKVWQQAGYELGVHPSYGSCLDPGKTRAEKESLEAVVGPVEISRQHYLRYRLPDTFQALASLGIRREYSLCLSSKSGAATGVALPYRWFDLVRNRETGMTMVPAMVMDRALQQGMGCNPDAAGEVIAEWIGKVRSVSGRFVLILHNETFSESGEWKGWTKVIRQSVELLQR